MRWGSSDEVSGSVMTTTVTWKKEDVGIDQKDKQRKVVVFFFGFFGFAKRMAMPGHNGLYSL